MSYEFIGSGKLKGFMKGIAEHTDQPYEIHTEWPNELAFNIDYFGNVVFVGSPKQICDKNDYWDLIRSVERHEKFCAAVIRDEHSMPANNRGIDCIVRSGSATSKDNRVPFNEMADKLNKFFRNMKC